MQSLNLNIGPASKQGVVEAEKSLLELLLIQLSFQSAAQKKKSFEIEYL